MLPVQEGLKDEGASVPMTKLCASFGVARRTTYYKPTRSPPTVKHELAAPSKELIEAEPYFSYRTVAALLGINKNTLQRIFQQVRKRAMAQRPRIDPPPTAGPSVGRDFDFFSHLGNRLGSVFSSEFRKGFPCQFTVGALLLIETPPCFDFARCIDQRQEPVLVQTLLPQSAVKALHHRILRRRTTGRKPAPHRSHRPSGP